MTSQAVSVERFTLHVPQAALHDLQERLARARWPGELDGPGWQDGTSPAYLRELVTWWRSGFKDEGSRRSFLLSRQDPRM